MMMRRGRRAASEAPAKRLLCDVTISSLRRSIHILESRGVGKLSWRGIACWREPSMMFAFNEGRLHLLGTIVCTVALVNAVS